MKDEVRAHWIQWYGYVPHESHKLVDVSDASYIHDLMCDHCHRCDEELESSCNQNPYWQVII